MPRTKTISDDDILAAALEILSERGASFTLTDLATRIGLARATLIQRFGDRDAILLRMATFEVETTQAWLASLPVESGADGLWRFLEHVVGSMGTGEGFAARVSLADLEARDPGLRSLARTRYALVQAAIAARLPNGPSQRRVAEHLHTVIAGATMQWAASERKMGLSTYVLNQLRWTLDHLPIDLR